MIITQAYLIIPVGIGAEAKTICFYENGALLFDLKIHYRQETPDFLFYQPTAPLLGHDVTMSIDGEPISFAQTDEKNDEGIGKESLRPYLHFTARRGWINDPNGLHFDGERYHMFFQHNPVGVLWGNMHWGHAVSKDLLHWQEADDVLFPDCFGTMYSGSAIVDENHVSGLGESAICLFYTSCGDASNGGNSLLSRGMESTQHLAYSTDGGNTFIKYEGNPILDEVTKENRDPKVIWAEELGCYLMVLYLECNDYLLLTSSDLIHWESRQRLTIMGESECPDIYPLTVEGQPEERLWILTGASDRYVVGRLYPDGELFRPVQDVKAYQIGKCNYAAQTFSGIQGRRIKTAWGMMPAPNCIFNNQMSLFTEVSLVEHKDEYLLRTRPIAEYDTIATPYFSEMIHAPLVWELGKEAYEVTVSPGDRCSTVTVSVNGRVLVIDPIRNVMCDGEREIPLRYTEDPIVVRIIADTLGLEMFLDNGLIHYAVPHIGNNVLAVEGCAKVSIRTFEDIEGREVGLL